MIVDPHPEQLWSIEKPQLPKRSRLYHLPPVGVGTPFVESLTSYIARLAKSHSVFPGILLSKEIVPLVPKVYRSTNLFGTRNLTGAVNGTGTMALDLVQALETLTLRNDLPFLTLISWTNVLPQRKLLRPVRAWCPTCYEEWRSTKQIIYEPLMWSIEALTLCPLHRKRLHFQCPHCRCQLSPLAPYSQPGYCSKCLKWLGISSNSGQSNSKALGEEELVWQIFVSDSIGKLLAAASHLPQPLLRERMAQAFCAYVTQVTEGNIAAFARLLQIPKNKVWMWHSGKVLPQLNVLLKVCYCLRTSVLNFLLKDTVEENVNLMTTLPQTQVVNQFTQPPNVESDLNRVQRLLEGVLQGDEEPPSPMTEVAKHLGYDKRVLRRRFPGLCKAISAQYLEYKKEARAERIKQCCEEVQQAVKHLYTQGVYPSEANVSKTLARPGCFRDKEVRAALQQARCQLGV
ncbi:MAG: TniQ family protein [Cyanobacteriota bacterium]